MRKIFILLSSMFLLNGCFESVALVGTTVTGGLSKAKIVQSSLNSGVSYGIKKTTGKSPLGHALAYAKENNPEKKKEPCISFVKKTNSEICKIVKNKIDLGKAKIKEKDLLDMSLSEFTLSVQSEIKEKFQIKYLDQ